MAANWLVVTLPLPANHVTADHSDRAGVQPCRVPLFSVWGVAEAGGGERRMRWRTVRQKGGGGRKRRGQPLCFPLTVSHICSRGAHARLCSSARVRCHFCFVRGRFQVPARVVMCQPACRRAATVNVFFLFFLSPACSEYTPVPCCLQRVFFIFLASSQAPSSSTPLRPQWLILTRAAVVSNQHSQPRT